ncbi:MAG: tRNA uridine-5-carboxymethylaminomethyl(34) synthesis GTPase MnmE [Christensenellaceae bacterium]|jgi:tRNA modification GTPase|nr:tRNA uridine-5-carboxymethylaminomethyl(34) synthesis GTPase MnmE [Christensenellaceae bacterium]
MKSETIAAIATPKGTGGVGIVRISGENSLKVLSQFFIPYKAGEGISAVSRDTSAKEILKMVPRYMYLGEINNKELKEQCLAVFFKDPNSYTGEDVVEIHCHGGVYICNKILELCLRNGARLADPGEFSKRAFVNGKLSLDSAEGVIDLINAASNAEARAAFNLFDGKLFKIVKAMQNALTDILAEIEVNLDYPEHDIEYETSENIKKRLTVIENTLNQLLDGAKTGMLLKHGVSVLILGKPNVGKSSLLNTMLNFEKAIVTDIAGTTRDVVEGTYIYKDIKFNLSDTAGIRDTQNKIERIGIDKAKAMTEAADIILLLLDSSTGITKEDKQSMSLLGGKECFVVVNKIDSGDKIDYGLIKDKFDIIKISAKNNIGITELKEAIFKKTVGGVVANETILLNLRHTEALNEALYIIGKTLPQLLQNSLDCVAVDIKQVWEVLGKITGEGADEVVIDAIFSKFCLGK